MEIIIKCKIWLAKIFHQIILSLCKKNYRKQYKLEKTMNPWKVIISLIRDAKTLLNVKIKIRYKKITTKIFLNKL